MDMDNGYGQLRFWFDSNCKGGIGPTYTPLTPSCREQKTNRGGGKENIKENRRLMKTRYKQSKRTINNEALSLCATAPDAINVLHHGQKNFDCTEYF